MDNNTTNTDQEDSKNLGQPIKSSVNTKNRLSLKDRIMKYASIIIILALGIVIIFQFISSTKEKNIHQTEVNQLKERTRIELKTKLLTNSKKQLTLMMKPLVWAVRGSLIRKNDDEIAQYFYEMVQEDNIEEVVLIDNKNMIQVSTNKKNEQKKFTNLHPKVDLKVNQITFSSSQAYYQLVAPVLSLDQRIGTLYIKINNEFYIDSTATATIDTSAQLPSE